MSRKKCKKSKNFQKTLLTDNIWKCYTMDGNKFSRKRGKNEKKTRLLTDAELQEEQK